MISKIIHQTWKTKNIRLYSDGITGVISQDSWRRHFPNYQYKLWTDSDILKLIKEKYKFTLEAYQGLNKQIKRADLARYIILFDQGGIYSDLDFISRQPFSEKLIDEYDFIGYKAYRGYFNTQRQIYETMDRGTPNAWVLGQAFFGCRKGYAPLMKTIESIVSNYKSCEHPLLHTGPEKFHQVMTNERVLCDEKTYIFSLKEMGNNEGWYGYHLRRHNWEVETKGWLSKAFKVTKSYFLQYKKKMLNKS